MKRQRRSLRPRRKLPAPLPPKPEPVTLKDFRKLGLMILPGLLFRRDK